MTCNQTENDIRVGLNDTFIIEDGGVVSQLELDGLTLVNIMPDTGKTPLISNNDGTYNIDKGLDEGIILDTGKMLSGTLYGETMINILNDEDKVNEVFTFYTAESNVKTLSYINFAEPAKISTGEVRGFTFENKVPMYGQSEQVTITGTVNVADLIDNSANGVCALDNQYKKPKKLFFVATMVEVTE